MGKARRRGGWGEVVSWGWGIWLAAVLAGVLFSGCEPRSRLADPLETALQPVAEVEQYRRLVLSNGLKVLLVSDPGAERSGASISVGVGSLDDPSERPGMAHFLEHMLFLGTEKYPQPGAYQKYLSRYDGFSNAYTADDHTNYFFEITHRGFEEGLDRFAWFFISPSLNQEYAVREVNAVDSEHSKNIENDYWRLRQIQRNTYDPAHPINHFSTGNLKTLSGVGNAELRAFYQRQYSSNRMALSVVGNRTLDELEQLVRARFGLIKNRTLPRNKYPLEFLKPKAALRVLMVEPVADQRALAVTFPLPSTEHLYATKPLQLIASVMGNEAPGSLLSLLKAENLATGLSAGSGESTADYSSFVVRIALTPNGQARYQEVVRILLATIEGLRREGIPRYFFDESSTMAALEYRFRERQSASSLVQGLSAQMLSLPLAALPEAAYHLTRFDPRAIGRLLEKLRPGNMLVTLLARGVETEKVEPFYQARYGYREWSGEPYRTLAAVEPDPRWHVPAQNPFIPKGVTLRHPKGKLKLADATFFQLKSAGVSTEVRARLESLRNATFAGSGALYQGLATILPEQETSGLFPKVLENALHLPEKLMDTPRAKIWFQPGWRFRQPKGTLTLKFYTQGASASPRAVMLGELYQAALAEALNEYGYPIREAGLSFSLDANLSGVVFSVAGYSSPMLGLMRELATRLRTIPIDEQTFAAIKEAIRRGLQNAHFQQPYVQARYFGQLLLQHPTFTLDAKEKALEEIDLAAVRAFAARLYDRVYVEGVAFGNLEPQAVRAAVRRVLDILESQPLPEAERVKKDVRLLALESNYIFTERLLVNNSYGSYYYQVGPTNPRLRGAMLIISRYLQENFYFDMRTQQQLGYIVYAGMAQSNKTLSFIFLVQSGAHPADTLLKRIEAYIPRFAKGFAALSEAEFEKYREAVIQAKLEHSKSMGEAAEHLFRVAFKKDEQWDHMSQEIRAVQTLTRAEVEEILQHNLLGRGTRRLAIRLLGKDHPIDKSRARPISIPRSARGEKG